VQPQELDNGAPGRIPERASLASRLGRLGRLARKELREILRDRRTILTMVLMPVLLYPLLGLAFNQYYSSNLAAPSAPEYLIAVSETKDARRLTRHLALGEKALWEHREFNEVLASARRPVLKLVPVPPAELDDAVHSNRCHLGIRLNDSGGNASRLGKVPTLTGDLIYLEDSVLGMNALAYIERCSAAANEELVEKQLGVAFPVRLTRAPVPETEEKRLISMAEIIPLMLILMTITGAVYPAIDLTAGERERGTLEILVAAPIPRLGLLLAKYTAVVTVALLTALVNIGSLTLTLQIAGLGDRLFGNEGWSLLALLEVFALLVLFAAFFSALLLILTSFARTFKEAQAYLVPLMLVSLVPGMLGIDPTLTLSAPLAFIPLLNIVLLARDVFRGTASFAMGSLVVVATVVYDMAAVTVASRVFGTDAVLSGERGTWSLLFRRRSAVGRAESG
jgi:ABC-2 type transport system permease protein/sodium transport system permease protein